MWQNDEFKRLVAKFDIRNSLFAIVMSDLAIRVEKLGKLYRIGQREPYSTLRDVLARSFAAPFRYLMPNAKSEFRNANLADPQPALLNSPSAIPNPQFAIRNPQSEYIWALKDASFEIKRGEVVGIIGRNGAGKSTLLKILSRITAPTEGEADVFGRVGSLLEVGTGFHPELTGRENVYLNGAILGMKKAEINRKFDEIVAFAEVEKFIDTPVKHYSSGMYLRLAFSVAAHLEPEILLVDEVLAVGDASFQKKCLGKIEGVAKGGRTVLFVSHNMTPIVQLCTQVLWLNSGGVVEKGDPRKVVSCYLRDNRISLGEAIFDPTQVSNGAVLVRAYVTDDGLSVKPDMPYSKPFYIVLEYSVEFPIDGLRVGIRLYNERHVAVLHTATSDCPTANGMVGRLGRHRVRVQIPGAWLAPGRYYAEVGLWSPKVGHHQHVVDGLAFDITGATVDSVGEEVLRPVLEWVVE